MTVALHDVVLLTDLLSKLDSYDEWEYISHVLHTWHWQRKPLGSTINILSIALYDLFGAEGMCARYLLFDSLLKQMRR